MKILAIETSTDQASIALLLDGRLIEHPVPPRQGPAETLLPAIRGLLAEAGVGLDALDAFAFSAGPGAFTSLRLGCGVAQGLALGCGKPVIPVGSLDVLARAAERAQVFVVADARMGEVYCAPYQMQDGQLQPLAEPVCCAPAEARLPDGEGWFGFGSGFRAYPDALLPALGVGLAGFDPSPMPRAGTLAQLAAEAAARGEAGDPADARLRYVRDKVAMTTAERLARGGKA